MPEHRSKRRWWLALGLAVLLGAPAALAVTTIRIEGLIRTVTAAVTAGGIAVGDLFVIEMVFDETQLTGGVESLTSTTTPALDFSLNIDNGDLIQDQDDDFFGSPVLTLDNGAFASLQFLSNAYADLGPLAFTKLTPAGPLDMLSGQLELLYADGPNENQPLILGEFTETSVSVN